MRCRPLEFEVGDHVFLKLMPKRGVVKFGKRRKLSPRFIRPFEVDTNGTFEEGPVCILDSRDQVLRRKTVRLVRVL